MFLVASNVRPLVALLGRFWLSIVLMGRFWLYNMLLLISIGRFWLSIVSIVCFLLKSSHTYTA